jgi:hypothetical protein
MHHALALEPVRAGGSGTTRVGLGAAGRPSAGRAQIALPTHIFLALHCATDDGSGLSEREASINLRRQAGEELESQRHASLCCEVLLLS